MYVVKNNLWAVKLQNRFVNHPVKSFLDLVSFFSSAMILTRLLYLDVFFLFSVILLHADELRFSLNKAFVNKNVIIIAFIFTKFFYLKTYEVNECLA